LPERQKGEDQDVHHFHRDLCCNANEPPGAETMDTESGKPKCRKTRCAHLADVVLESKDYCLDHFINYCYERLEMFDPLIRARSLEPARTLAARKFLQECSNRVLVVCFRYKQLTVSDRPRLLQILLWSEELQCLLRLPGIQQAPPSAQVETAHY
jgi:hypothetical protein